MKPAGALFSKNLIPIKIARLQLGGGSMATIRTPNGTAYAEAPFRKVQAVAYGPTDSIVGGPF
jgi:hypothetical protein